MNTKISNQNLKLFTPSHEQQTIIDAIKRGENISVNAVAGSGKTTTILGIASQIPNKKILQITYNRALKLEVENKAKYHNLTNLKVLTYHGLACAYYDYTSYTDDRIQEILKKNKPLSRSPSSIQFEIVIIDEIQDMTMLYFELVHKFLFDIHTHTHILLGIMGDNFQGIYGFKGADERFLTLGEQIFINHKPFTKLTLNTSYRLTAPMAQFVNNVMIGGFPRIKTIKHGSPVSYVQYPYNKLTTCIYNLIETEMKTQHYKPANIFILTGTLRSQRIKELENKLVSKGLLCFVPISEDSKLEEHLIKDKIVFTTFHQSKGRERPLTIVYGFDTSYYDLFKDKTSSLKICPNLLYVATTRASGKLIIVEHIDNYKALPFLKMGHADMDSLEYIQIHRHELLEGHKNINSKEEYMRREEAFEHDKGVCDLVKFIDESTLAILADLLNKVFKVIAESQPENTAIIPNDIKTAANNTYEQVCDINGIAIPAMLFSASKENKHINYLWNYLARTYLTNSIKRNNAIFIMGYITRMREHGLKSIADWLLLSNIYLCSTEGFNYKLKQIDNYEWLAGDMVARCHRNIDQFIDRGKPMKFEVELGCDYDEKGSYYGFTHPLYGIVKLRGRIDCMTNDTIWELKCVEMLSIEHMLQVVIYGWIWQQICNNTGGNIKNMDEKQKQKQMKELYQPRKFKLMNVRNGEVRELDITSHYINEIINILLDSKLRIREVISDKQFIKTCVTRIAKYTHCNKNDNNYNYDNDNDNEDNNIELDF